MKTLNDFKNQRMETKQMSNIKGGVTMTELIAAAWDATPEGGSSTWNNLGAGDCWGVLIHGEGPGWGLGHTYIHCF